VTLGIYKTQSNIQKDQVIQEQQEKQEKNYQQSQIELQNTNNPFKEPSRKGEHKIYDIPLPIEDQILIYEESEKYGLSPELIISIIKVESTFNTNATSKSKSSLGLMQLDKGTYPWIAKELNINNFNPYNSTHNIKAGIWYVNYLRDYWYLKGYSDEECFNLILLSYNCGIDGCKKYISKHGFNSSYTNKVTTYKDNLERNQ